MPQPSATEAADLLPPYPAQPFGGAAYGWPAAPSAPWAPSKPTLARWLVALAVAGAVTRLLIIAACANRISFADNLLNGGTGTFDDANQADHLVTAASVISGVAFLAFLGVLFAVRSRAKRGDLLCAAIGSNAAVRLTTRFYLISIVVSLFLRNAFKTDDSASADDQIHSVVHGDWASIGLNLFVIAFLVVVTVVTRREIAKAQASATAA